MNNKDAMTQMFRHLYALAGTSEEEVSEMVAAAGVEVPVTPEDGDFPSWMPSRFAGAPAQQRDDIYRFAQTNAMIRVALEHKRRHGLGMN